MSTRLQVVLDEAELDAIRQSARNAGMTVSEWVRQTIRDAQRRQPGADKARKLAAVRAATKHDFPTGDIDQMLAEIERGYQS